jgi:Glyoxalase/Bleomycin resistance protein/Dioxygenase superfamily
VTGGQRAPRADRDQVVLRKDCRWRIVALQQGVHGPFGTKRTSGGVVVAALAMLLSGASPSRRGPAPPGRAPSSTIAGSDPLGDFSGDGGPATAAQLGQNSPYSVAMTPDGGFLIGDEVNARVRRVSTAARNLALWIQVRDLAAEHQRLRAAGVEIVRASERERWGLLEMWIAGPDGVRIVLGEVPTQHPLRRDSR